MFILYYYIFAILCSTFVSCSENSNFSNSKNKKEIFYTDKTLYNINSLNIIFSDNFKDDEILKKNILSVLTFKKGDLINLKNLTILNNLNKIKKIFNIIKDVSFEVSNENVDGSIDLIINIKRYERIKSILFTDNNKKNEQVLRKLDFYIYKRLDDLNRDKIEKDISTTFNEKKYKIITFEGNTYEYIVKKNTKSKSIYVQEVKIIGCKNINANDILDNLNIRGVKYYSFKKGAFEILKNIDLNNFDLFKFISDAKRNIFIWNNINFNKNNLELDKKIILDMYLSKGYLDAEILKTEVKLTKNKDICSITYYINEGEQYFIGDFDFIGNSNIDSNVLKNIFDCKKGDPFNSIKINDKISENIRMDFRNSIKSLYSILGFTKSNISIRIKSIKDKFINFTVAIDEGEKCNVNKIIVNGNRYVNSTEFYKSSFLLPGEEFSYEKYIATQQNILRNEFLDPKKSFVNIDNDNNLQIFVEEKLGFEPIFNIKTEKIREGSCCDACKCCKIGPAINIGCKFSNLNLRKLFHLRNKRYSFLGSGDIFSFQLLFSPMDSKFSVDIGLTIREIVKGFGCGFSIHYSRNKGNIDSLGNSITDEKYLASNKGCCSNVIHDISLSNSFIFSSFDGRIFNLFYPIIFHTRIGRNMSNLLRCNLNINIINEFKYSTLAHGFWDEQGYEFGLTAMLTNPLCFLIKTKDINTYSINKYLTLLFHFVYFKRLYNKIVFNSSINIGYSKSFNDFNTSFKIEKEDSMYFDYSNGSTSTFVCLNGIKENSGILNLINSSICNLSFKTNLEVRYLFVNSPIINSYAFCFFNAGNLFLPSEKNKSKKLKFYGKFNIYNPFRFFSFGIGIRVEPEILKMLLQGLCFSFYYDFINMDFSFNFVKKK